MAQTELWIVAEEKCWKTEVLFDEKTDINRGKTKLCTKNIFSPVG